MESKRQLAKLSPFNLQKGIRGFDRKLKNVTQLRSGQVLSEVEKTDIQTIYSGQPQ